MRNKIYKLKVTNEQFENFVSNKVYVNLRKGKVYENYSQLVSDYKKTEYVSIDDFVLDDEIVNYSSLEDQELWFDVDKYILDDENVLLIVAIFQ